MLHNSGRYPDTAMSVVIGAPSRVPPWPSTSSSCASTGSPAQRLADAEDFADQVQRRLRPANTTDTYAKAWKVWARFCAAHGFPELEATRGALLAFVVWLLGRGRADGKGYAASSASTVLAGTVVELRRRGAEVGRDDQAQARATLEAAAVELLKAGERRGRGQAAAAEVPDL
ncbi:hypothetical protein ACFT9J_30265 [Streptomyces anthocyanicus]|uniref:hypothetical protein n=1 Tax=Streptomyces anthocyanicus TaxID=68174 RepID=UPI00362ABCD9